METDTFPRRDVQAFLANTIPLKIDASREDRVSSKFGVQGFPTFVLLHPNGDVLFKDSGKPPGAHFVKMFTYKHHNALVDAYNGKKYAEAARRAFFAKRWFPGTKVAKVAAEICAQLKKDQTFVDAYKRAETATAAELKTLKDRAEGEAKEAARRKRAAELKADADEIYGKRGKRFHSYKIYKKIILEFPRLPEAADARKRLRKHGVSWKEPKKTEKPNKPKTRESKDSKKAKAPTGK